MGFAASLRKHLADYKREHLRVQEDGLWKRKKKPYPHILPESEKAKNILETIRADFWKWFRRPKLHGDFHHLNSSQAMGFNLFFPFLNYGPGRTLVLLDSLGAPLEPIAGWEFEKIPDRDEGTNFDLWLKLESGKELFFELKLTEGEFGAAKANDRRREKWEALYRPRLEGRIDRGWLYSEKDFFKRYQLMRNLWHLNAERGDRLFLVFPAANRKLTEQADKFLSRLEGDWSERVAIVELEILCGRLRKLAKGDPLLEGHIAAFSAKYVPND